MKLSAVALALALTTVAVAGCAASNDEADPSGSADGSEAISSASVKLRFDMAGLDCGSAQTTCPAKDDKCLCGAEQAALNYASEEHFLVTATSAFRGAAHDRGNLLAAYDDRLNDPFDQGKTGRQGAIALAASIAGASGFGYLPRYLLLNEISRKSWSSPAYRAYVVDFVKTLANDFGLAPIVASPFALPAQYTEASTFDDWAAIAKYAYVAVEVQVTGQEAKDLGFDVAKIANVYRSSMASFDKVGVRKERLMILDNFANTAKGESFGRAGVGHDDWLRAIEARGKAVAPLGAAGYVSYAWSGNAMHDSSEHRREYMRAYAARALP